VERDNSEQITDSRRRGVLRWLEREKENLTQRRRGRREEAEKKAA
jgi:hypothetical protein